MVAVGGRYPAQRKYRTDGGRSFVRKALGTDFPGESMNARAVVADLSLSGLEDDIWRRRRTADQFVPAGEFDLSDAGIAAAIAARTGRAGIVVHAVHWRSDYAMSSRLAERYRAGRVFIAGDAAHVKAGGGLSAVRADARRAAARRVEQRRAARRRPCAGCAMPRRGGTARAFVYAIRWRRLVTVAL